MRGIKCKATFKGKLMFPNDYLSAVEFQGKDVTLTIAEVRTEELQTDNGKEPKWVLTFKETSKKLVLNKTNAASISQLHGPAAERWLGKEVTFYPTKVPAFGQMEDAIRVREGARTSQPQAQEEAPAEPEPAPF